MSIENGAGEDPVQLSQTKQLGGAAVMLDAALSKAAAADYAPETHDELLRALLMMVEQLERSRFELSLLQMTLTDHPLSPMGHLAPALADGVHELRCAYLELTKAAAEGFYEGIQRGVERLAAKKKAGEAGTIEMPARASSAH